MTTELTCLLVQALWGFVLVGIEVLSKTHYAGSAWNAGNRATTPEFPEWVRRTSRALDNHKENFPLFLTAVVVVHLAGQSDGVSAIAAIVYVVARVAHALLYMGGVTGFRTAAHITGVAAIGTMLSRLF